MSSALLARNRAFVAAETALAFGAVLAAAFVRTLGHFGFADPPASAPIAWRAAIAVLVWQLSLYYADLYSWRISQDLRRVITGLLQALAMAWLGLTVVYFFAPSLKLGRGIFLIAFLLLPTMSLAWRLLAERIGLRGTGAERLLIEVTGPDTIQLVRELHERRHELGLEIAGFVDRDPSRVGVHVLNPGVVGTIDDLPELARRFAANRVAVVTSTAFDQMPLDRLLGMQIAGVGVDHVAAVYEEYTGKVALDVLTPALVFSAGFIHPASLHAAKRAIDLVAAGIGLVVSLPLMILTALAIKLTSRGPVFYHQQRVGLKGRLFTLHKFRSMTANAEASTGPTWALDDDARVTRVGRLLRRTRLDELPQLWNVLRGEMSLVGPRPERPELEARLVEQIPLYIERQLVKPGITGWAQVRHRYADSVENTRVKLQYDLYYVKHMSLAFDFLILLKTTKTVLRGTGAK